MNHNMISGSSSKYPFNCTFIKFASTLMLISFLVILLSSIASSSDDIITVAVSILPMVEFVEQIGDRYVETMVMIPPGASPATYELTPGQMKKLSKANLYIKVGTYLPFEHVWLERISNLNPDMFIVDCSEGIDILIGAENENLDVNLGKHHPHGQDPHIWNSPKNATLMVDNITQGLVAIDPGHKEYYEQNSAAYKQKLDDLDKEIKQLFSNVTKRKFMILHPAWGYFTKRYGLTQLPIEVEGKEPGMADLKRLVNTAKAEGLNVVFASPQFNPESAEIIASEIGGEVIFIDPLAEEYITNMRATAQKLAETMK